MNELQTASFFIGCLVGSLSSVVTVWILSRRARVSISFQCKLFTFRWSRGAKEEDEPVATIKRVEIHTPNWGYYWPALRELHNYEDFIRTPPCVPQPQDITVPSIEPQITWTSGTSCSDFDPGLQGR